MAMPVFSAIFSLLIAIAGWYYMFYSRAAVMPGAIEAQPINRKRHRLRQVGGLVMFLLAIGFYSGSNTVDVERSALAFVLVWSGVMFLLLSIIVLVLMDLRLTWRLHHQRRN